MASPSLKMSEENLEKKMQNLTNTQDSIQGLSLWLIHHKSHHKRVVDVWLNMVKKSPVKHKLILFNLCNDVCQNGKRKKALVYLDSFKTVLAEALFHARDMSIRPNLERILKIWGERNIFPKTFISELNEQFLKEQPTPSPGINSNSASSTPISTTPTYKPTSKVTVKDEEKILAEFKPQILIDKINSYKRLEGEVELKFKQISSLKLDASSVEAITQLKDRAHGKQFSQQFEDSCSKLENYVSSAEQQLVEERIVIDLLEQSEVFYDEQYREAKIVANAYKNFGTRINNLRKKLEELIKSLPSPVPSPSYDAPSPGNTPPLEEIDNTEAVDMDLDDDENAAHTAIHASQENNSTTQKKDPRDDEVYDPEEQYSPSKPKYIAGPNALESRIATMIPSLPTNSIQHATDPRAHSVNTTILENAPVYTPPKPAVITVLQQSGGTETPTKDEGSSTPVMDEKEDSPPRSQHQNPIDFLTQILSKTTKSSAPSSNFLQNLSILTNTVKTQFQQNKDVPAPVDPPQETPNSWAEWKAQMQPPEDMPSLSKQSAPQSHQLQPPMYSHSTQSLTQPSITSSANIVSPIVSAPSSLPQPHHIPPAFTPQLPQTAQRPQGPDSWTPSPQPSQPFPTPSNFTSPPSMPSTALPQAPISGYSAPSQGPSGTPVTGYGAPGAPPVGGFTGPPAAQGAPPVGGFSAPPIAPVSAPHSGFPVSQPGHVSPTWNPPNQQTADKLLWNPPAPEHANPVWNPPAPSPTQGNAGWSQPSAEHRQPWSGEESWDRNWESDEMSAASDSSSSVAVLPPPPKGILRNRKSSLKEVPITPSDSSDDISAFPKPPQQPPSPTDAKPKLSKLNTHGSAPDDHREFLEKLKRKTTGNSNSNLISPPVMEGNSKSSRNASRPNLTNITVIDVEESENTETKNAETKQTDNNENGEDSALKIETVQVVRRYEDKSDDIRMPEKPSLHGEGDYDHDHREEFDHRHRYQRNDHRPPFRGPPGPHYRHPGPPRGGYDPYFHRERPPIRHYHDSYDRFRRPYYY